MSIAENIRALREARGLKQKDCAKRAKVSQSTWCDWESGKMSPRVAKLDDVARVLGVKKARLLA